ncbi:MAG: choice-of-anchor D domain-containing protein, partial [Deltaproteobacteria bacterium]
MALIAMFFAPQLALSAPAADGSSPYVVQQGGIPSPKGNGSTVYPMRRTTQKDRGEAAVRAHERIKANEQNGAKIPAHVSPVMKAGPKGAAAAILELAIAAPGAYDLYASPNWALTKLPWATCVDPSGTNTGQACQKDFDCAGWVAPFFIGPYQYADGETCTGPATAGTGIRKFVNSLPGICTGAGAAVSPWIAAQTAPATNCITLATPDTTSFPGADYYELGVGDFTQQLHSDLPATTRIRGYYQKNMGGTQKRYLGPLIIATEGRPVRVKFVNEIPTGLAGNLFIPMDENLTGVGYGPLGVSAGKYTQNRIAVHLHGGNTPWISDGTQHQWKVPAGESTVYQQGVSLGYVPDMWWDGHGNPIPSCNNKTWPAAATCNVAGATNNPGPGILTYYWTNQQSTRLMWYHDHAYGITRLNAYIGQAAGYLVRTPIDEDDLRTVAHVPGTLGTDPNTWDLSHLIPLVIQEKTFVPPDTQMAQQDPSWDYAAWGGEGNFWLPHVYTTNQWPGNPDLSGNNPFGRWDYGPWFWPIQTQLATREGVQRPLFVDCQSAAAVTAANPNGDTQCPSVPNPSLVPESFLDTPMVNGTPYPTVNVKPESYRFLILNGSQERNWNLSWFEADAAVLGPNGTATEVKMVPAIMHDSRSVPALCPAPTADNVSPVTGLVPGCWPRAWPVDGRQGGVPDPATAGPKWVQIGTEGGILPNPAEIVPQPVDFEYNRRNVVVLNVASRGLFMGPAERADVIVDFSAYAGKTLILYNDSPAPVPASDPRQDFYTWDPDFTLSGGAPTTLPGYGPNTRTVMQVRVAATGTPNPVNATALATVVPTIFNRSQPLLVVPQSEYNSVYQPGLTCPGAPACYTDQVLAIQDTTITYTPMAKRTETPTNIPVTTQLQYKALHELFDTEYGRMNSVLGVEIPLTTWVVQTTIPYTNYDPATEFFIENQVQVWKTTHNGVDTHTIHYHLVDVQLINRVGWDGSIRRPDPNELGWKEVVRYNPLEDAFFAIRPKMQVLPWPLRDNVRPYDVDAPLGTSTQFTGVDIMGNPINVVNEYAAYGNEYVWHCHLLGHEENDMLRAEVFVTNPQDPSGLVVSRGLSGGTGFANLTWTDNSLSALTFNVQRANDAAFQTGIVNFTTPAPVTQPGPVTFQDPGPLTNPDYYYRVQATKTLTSIAMAGTTFTASSAWTPGVLARIAPVATLSPAALTFVDRIVNSGNSTAQLITLRNTGAMALTVTSIANSNATDFGTTTTCGAMPATVAVGGSCTVSVVFHPTTRGVKNANVTFTTNDPVNPVQIVTATGKGVAGVASVTYGGVAISDFAFGTVAVGSNASATLVLNNTGDGLLAVTSSSIIVTGTSTGFTRQSTTCGASLAIGASCNIVVRYAPTSTALANNSTLRVITNSGGVANTQTNIALQGNPLAATSVGLVASLTSPQPINTPVTFTATGAGSTGLPASGYYYQFSTGPSAAGPWTVVQSWRFQNTYLLPGATAGTFYVKVDARAGWVTGTPTSQANANMPFVIGINPATGVTVTPATGSSSTYGTPVTFTATGTGSVVGATYYYQFTLDGGTPSAWTTGNTYLLAADTLGGVHTLVVGASTHAGPEATPVTRTMTHTVNYPAATGVTIDVGSPTSPQLFGTAVTFTATGSSSASLPTAAYKYRVKLDSGAFGNWGAGGANTYVMPGTTAAGNHTVTVETSTAATPAGTGNPTATSATYVIYAAPSVTLNPSPASGQLYGTSVTFTASASGGNPGLTYKYRFSVNSSIVQDYSTTATYTTSTLPVQSNTVTVDLSTAVSPVAPEATANSTFVISGYPAATGLTVTPSAASPQLYGTAVTFTAAGQNAPALPTSAYTYRFTLDGTVVQNWSTLATWTMPGTTAVGAHSLVVDVTTTATPANTPFTVTVPYT